MHPNVPSSIIYNSQDIETTLVSINRGMSKENIVYTHTDTQADTHTVEYYST